MSDEDFGVEIPDKMFFRIGEAAQLVGVEPHVLRYWEGEFRMRPQRSQAGQRMYRRKDLAKFIRIRRLLHDEGFTIAGARKALTEGTSRASDDQPSQVDAERVRNAVARLEDLRRRIAEAKNDLGGSLR